MQRPRKHLSLLVWVFYCFWLLLLGFGSLSAQSLPPSSEVVASSEPSASSSSINLGNLPEKAPTQEQWDRFRVWAKQHWTLDEKQSMLVARLDERVKAYETVASKNDEWLAKLLGLQESSNESMTKSVDWMTTYKTSSEATLLGWQIATASEGLIILGLVIYQVASLFKP